MDPSKEPDWQNAPPPVRGEPYAAPASDAAGEGTVYSLDNLTELEVRSFVGPRANYYLARWEPALDDTGPATGFNWPAFLLSGLWLPYRKMYLITALFFGIILVESTLEEVLFVGILGRPEAPAGLGHLVGLVAAIFCGALGNRWYLSHTRKAISALRSRGLPEDAYLQALDERGGTSVGAAVGFFLLFLVAAFAILFLLELAFEKR